jgi:hypothetical protein
MGLPLGNFPNRGPIEYTSISSAVAFDPPIAWIQVVTAGSGGLVVKSQDGTAQTYAGLVAGDIYYGPFNQITSMTCSKIRVGDGAVPPANPALAATQVNGTTVPAGGALTTGNVLQVSGASALTYAPVNVGGGSDYVIGSLPATNQQRYSTAATQTASWTVAVDILYILNTTNTAATATLPAISSSNDGHVAAMFNAGTTAAVWTPASGDTVGGTAASNATKAGPAAGVMATLVANLATRRWIPLA